MNIPIGFCEIILTSGRTNDNFKGNLMVLLIKRGGGIWPLEASAADFFQSTVPHPTGKQSLIDRRSGFPNVESPLRN
jgi:hypothetical protein